MDRQPADTDPTCLALRRVCGVFEEQMWSTCTSQVYVCVHTDAQPKWKQQLSTVSYLSRCDVWVSDVSVDVLNLRQLPLCHLNQLGTVQVTGATERSFPPQWSLPLSFHRVCAPSFCPPCSPLPPLPPKGPSIPQLFGCRVVGAGVMVELWGTWWCPFLFLTPILL